MLVADGLTTDVLRAAIRVGFKDVVDAPLNHAKIDSMLGHVEKAESMAGKEFVPKTKIGKVITIMSPKGGAGKTMTSSNVSLALAMMSGTPERVVVMDADLQFGDICISLQVEPQHTIVDAARDIDKLDEQLLDSLLATHSSGMRVRLGFAHDRCQVLPNGIQRNHQLAHGWSRQFRRCLLTQQVKSG